MHERPLEATSPFVFLAGLGRQRCEPLSYDALVKLFSRRMSALGLRTPETTPHALRHTHATASLGGRHASPRLLTCRSQRGGGHWAVCQLSGTVVWTR